MRVPRYLASTVPFEVSLALTILTAAVVDGDVVEPNVSAIFSPPTSGEMPVAIAPGLDVCVARLRYW